MTAGRVADGPVRPDASVPLRQYRLLFGGAWVDARSGATFQTVDPFTGRAWAEIPRAGPEGVDEAVRARRLSGPAARPRPRASRPGS